MYIFTECSLLYFHCLRCCDIYFRYDQALVAMQIGKHEQYRVHRPFHSDSPKNVQRNMYAVQELL